jgi:hypothetical protein
MGMINIWAISFGDQEVGILAMACFGVNKPPFIAVNILTECSLDMWHLL